MDAKKDFTVQDWPVPRDRTELQKVWGLANSNPQVHHGLGSTGGSTAVTAEEVKSI